MKRKKRSTRLTKKRFRQLKRELFKAIRDLGYSISYRERPVSWSDPSWHVYGFFDEFEKLITVIVRGKCGHAKILHMIAHELRHAIHVEERLYRDYYGLNLEMMHVRMKGSNVQWKWPNLGVAIRAERDCDRWAHKWLQDRGVRFERDTLYPFDSTVAYSMTRRMKAYENRVHRKQPVMH